MHYFSISCSAKKRLVDGETWLRGDVQTRPSAATISQEGSSHSFFFLLLLLSTCVQLAGKLFITKQLPSMMGSENLPSSICDEKTSRNTNCPPVSSASPEGEPSQGKISGGLPYTFPAPVPMLCVGPRWMLHEERRSGQSVAMPDTPAQGPSSHEDHTMEELFLCLR